MPHCKDDGDMDDDGGSWGGFWNWRKQSACSTVGWIVKIIVGAIIVGLLILLFLWLLPIIGFLFGGALVVVILILAVIGLVCLFKGAKRGWQRRHWQKYGGGKDWKSSKGDWSGNDDWNGGKSWRGTRSMSSSNMDEDN
jgi:hypothetical protein